MHLNTAFSSRIPSSRPAGIFVAHSSQLGQRCFIRSVLPLVCFFIFSLKEGNKQTKKGTLLESILERKIVLLKECRDSLVRVSLVSFFFFFPFSFLETKEIFSIFLLSLSSSENKHNSIFETVQFYFINEVSMKSSPARCLLSSKGQQRRQYGLLNISIVCFIIFVYKLQLFCIPTCNLDTQRFHRSNYHR